MAVIKLFQLVAQGPYAELEGSNKIYSKRVFQDRRLAEDYQEEFKKKCTYPVNSTDFLYLAKVERIRIIELEFDDASKTNIL